MNFLNQLTKNLDKTYTKLPALPKGINVFIVAIVPWMSLIFGILAILSGIAAFGALSFISLFAFAALVPTLKALILLIQGVIEIMAFSPLRVKKMKGWNLLYYVLILNIVSSILTINVSNILSALVGALIGYYFLYQIKSYYKA